MKYLVDNIPFLLICLALVIFIVIYYKEIASAPVFISLFIFVYVILGNINLVFFQTFFGWYSNINPKNGNNYALLGLIIMMGVLILFKKRKKPDGKKKLSIKHFDKYLTVLCIASIILNTINYSKFGGIVIFKGGLTGYERFALRDQLIIPKALSLSSFLISPLIIRLVIEKSKRLKFVILFLIQVVFAFGMGDRHLIFIPALIACIYLYYCSYITNKKILVCISLIPVLLILSSFFRGDANSVALESANSYFGSEYRDYLRLTNDKIKFENGSTIASVFFNAVPKEIYELFDADKSDYTVYSAYVLMDLWGNDTGQRAGIWGEFYLNFGYIGLLICFAIYGFLLIWVDKNLIRSNFLTRRKIVFSYVFSLFFFSVFGSWATIGDDIGTFGLFYATFAYFSFK